MKDINILIGNNIKKLRKENRLTQLELAEKINYSNKAISRWESGDVIPDVATLNKICEIFNVPIGYIFEDDSSNVKIQNKNSLKIGNKLTITLLSILLIWFIATILFVYSGIIFNDYYWMAFVWAVPATCIVSIVFNSIWGKIKYNFIFISILVWSILLCLYLLLLKYNIWPIFLTGIPMQVGVVLWYNISRNIEKNKNN